MSPVSTGAHSVAFLSDVIMGIASDLVGKLDVEPGEASRWDLEYDAIFAGIEAQFLQAVVLELHQPDGVVAPVFEFPITYVTGEIGQYEHSRAMIGRYREKLAAVAPGTTHHLLHLAPNGYSSGIDAGSRSRIPTDGLHSTYLGMVAEAPQARVSMRHWR